MDAQQERVKKANEKAYNFREEFFREFGIRPHVIFDIRKDSANKHVLNDISLAELENACNEIGNTYYPEVFEKYHIGKKIKLKEVVLCRQMYFALAKEMGFTAKMMVDHLGIGDSALTIHSSKKINNLLELGDKFITEFYQKVRKEIQIQQNKKKHA